MYCPNCNRPRPDSAGQCPECGSPLLPASPVRRGRLWPPLIFICVMLALGITIFLLSIPKEEVPSDTPWFSVNGGTLYFYPESYTGGDTLRVPSTVDGETVRRLAPHCFQNCDGLVTVELPDSLTTIGAEAFADCDALRGIKVPEQVKTIEKSAFVNCPSLEAIYIPGSVTEIQEDAFAQCPKLVHIFFVGDLSQWMQLYPGELNIDTEVYSVSGPDADSFSPA